MMQILELFKGENIKVEGVRSVLFSLLSVLILCVGW